MTAIRYQYDGKILILVNSYNSFNLYSPSLSQKVVTAVTHSEGYLLTYDVTGNLLSIQSFKGTANTALIDIDAFDNKIAITGRYDGATDVLGFGLPKQYSPFQQGYSAYAYTEGFMMSIGSTTLFQNISTNISNINLENNQNIVYPNPFTNELVIQCSNCSQWEIFDSTGKLIFSSSSSQTINTADWISGLYLLRTLDKNTVSVQKIIKQ